MRARAKAHKCPAVYLEKSEEDGIKKQKELAEHNTEIVRSYLINGCVYACGAGAS
jgi:hypothetical protein